MNVLTPLIIEAGYKTAKEFAESIGVSDAVVSRAGTKKRFPSANTLKKISEGLNRDISEISELLTLPSGLELENIKLRSEIKQLKKDLKRSRDHCEEISAQLRKALNL